MKPLTLTPDTYIYVLALLCVSAMSCAGISDLVLRLLRSRLRAPFLPVYVFVMFVVAICAILFLPLHAATNISIALWLVSCPVGIVLGACAAWWDTLLKRAFLQRFRADSGHVKRAARQDGHGHLARTTRVLPIAAQFFMLGGPWARHVVLGQLLLIGALEEFLFRGVLVDLALQLSSPPLVAIALAGITITFALSHVALGVPEVVAKLALGSLCLTVVLVFDSILPALIAHLWFNFLAWRMFPDAFYYRMQSASEVT